MTRIATVSEKMKLKLDLGDYPIISPKEAISSVQEVKEVALEKKPTGRKIYAIARKDMLRLEEIFKKRVDKKKQSTISSIMSEAIQLLYAKEMSL